MHLDSCRELKHSLRERPQSLTEGTELSWLGLGIARTLAGEYSLAVRLTDSDVAPELLRQLASEARDEIDVLSVGQIRALDAFSPGDLQKRRRPLVPGCSIGHPDVTAGTLGGFVTVEDTLHVLSNNHVLGNAGEGDVGDAALQPGTADDGSEPDDVVGRLAAMSKLSEDRPNVVDAAIAAVAGGIEHDLTAYPGGALGGTTEEPRGVVEKLGRTTGHTQGRVTAFEVDGLRITFPNGELVFDDQIEIAGEGGGFSDGGDSGSLIWTEEDRAVLGLLFAGSQIGGPGGTGLTYANPIRPVLEEFGAELASDQG